MNAHERELPATYGAEAICEQRALTLHPIDCADRRKHPDVWIQHPVLIDPDGEHTAGHGRVLAVKTLGLDLLPTIALRHPSQPTDLSCAQV